MPTRVKQAQAAPFDRAFEMHQAGDLAAARAAYLALLRKQPDHFDALHMLGVTALQSGDFAEAAGHIERALRLHDGYGLAWLNLAGAYRGLGQVAEAADCVARRIALDGEDAATLVALADLCLAAGRPADARQHYARLLELDPQNADAATGLGIALRELGHHDEALHRFEHALVLEAAHLRAANNIGITLCEQGHYVDALAQFDRLLSRAPGYAPAHNARALALWKSGRQDEAERAYDHAIELDPGYADAYNNRGALLATLGQDQMAMRDYRRALEIDPRRAEARNCLGALLASQHRLDEAIEQYRLALARRPDFAQAHNNLGVALAEAGHLQEAMVSYNRAIELEAANASSRADALANRSGLWARMRRYAEAATDARAALAINAKHPFTLGNALYLESVQCDWRYRAERITEIEARIRSGDDAATPFVVLTVCSSPELQLAAARDYAKAQFATHEDAPASPPPHARMRLAFVSSDFHEHATAYLIAGLLEHIDKTRFELFALSYGPTTADRYQQRLTNAVDRFIPIHRESDAQAAQRMRELGIDIAVDLKGFTHNARPGIFSHRGAPVQVSYLGYPGTTGMPQIDYLVADRITVPVGHERYYSEQIVRLPHCYQCNDASRPIAARTFTRSELGLPDEGFVFCSFNNNYKITPEVFDIWMRLLRQVDGSVLWLLQDNPAVAVNLRREAAARNVAPERLVFAPRLPTDEHLARHRCADLFLDTWPVNAHTTASDALWAGLPMITLLDSAFAGRVAASLLHAIGQPGYVATDAAGYEALALALARDGPRLVALHRAVRQASDNAVLFDTRRFTRYIEQAFEHMQRRQRVGLPPASFDVASTQG